MYVSVFMEPAAGRTPGFLLVPGLTVSRFEPRLEILFSISCRTPYPMDMSAMTAATPMMMPSIVSKDRSLLAAIDSHAMMTLSQ